MIWFVYIIKCDDNSFYTGITDNLNRRYNEHKEGRGGKYTLKHRPLQVVYFEKFDNKQKALKREKQLKGWSRKKKTNLINFAKKAG